MAIEFNPLDPKFHRDPYPFFHRLRAEDPVHRTRGFEPEWLLTRYADVNAVLRSRTRVGVDTLPQRLISKRTTQANCAALANLTEQWLFLLDPPCHTQVRATLGTLFSPARIARRRSWMQGLMDSLIEKKRRSGRMDVVADIASQLPVTVIAGMLGLPQRDIAQLKMWACHLIRVFDSLMTLEDFWHLNDVALALTDYCRRVIAQHERSPRDDLISALMITHDDAGFSREQLMATCVMLFVAGEKTTQDLIANSMLALLNHPDQLQLLRQHPEWIETAVEECLRYDPPVQFMPRIAREDFTLSGRTIHAGDRVVACVGAANRDPAQFPNPDTFDITRKKNPHLAFSAGLHHCVGAALARLEAQIAASSLVQRLPELRLDAGHLLRRENIGIRGLKALPVRFSV